MQYKKSTMYKVAVRFLPQLAKREFQWQAMACSPDPLAYLKSGRREPCSSGHPLKDFLPVYAVRLIQMPEEPAQGLAGFVRRHTITAPDDGSISPDFQRYHTFAFDLTLKFDPRIWKITAKFRKVHQ